MLSVFFQGCSTFLTGETLVGDYVGLFWLFKVLFGEKFLAVLGVTTFGHSTYPCIFLLSVVGGDCLTDFWITV
jgi:hypothetical protein